jgi:hypothetical protein
MQESESPWQNSLAILPNHLPQSSLGKRQREHGDDGRLTGNGMAQGFHSGPTMMMGQENLGQGSSGFEGFQWGNHQEGRMDLRMGMKRLKSNTVSKSWWWSLCDHPPPARSSSFPANPRYPACVGPTQLRPFKLPIHSILLKPTSSPAYHLIIHLKLNHDDNPDPNHLPYAYPQPFLPEPYLHLNLAGRSARISRVLPSFSSTSDFFGFGVVIRNRE